MAETRYDGLRSVVLKHAALFTLLALPVWAQEGPFGSGLYQVFEKAACRSCHTDDGVASGSRLHFPGPGSPPEKIEAFGRSLVELVNRDEPDASLLIKKPTNRVAHGGGERIAPGSPDETVLKSWVGQLTKLSGVELALALKYREGEAAGEGEAKTAEPELRRLTHSQYNHTVRDLLGDQSNPASKFPPEDFVNGFKNQSRGQSLSPLLIEAYSAAAERLARAAMQGIGKRNLIPCKPSAACRARFVREFGLKAFRRPLELGEQKRYQALLARETDFNKGVQLVIEAMLQSPYFLLRPETTANPRLKPYLTASRLSYALWDTMPDAELFAAAARGDLSTAQGVEKTARRMLASPRAKESLNEFVSQWLRFDRLLTTTRDRRKYPSFNRETAAAMTQEARTFVSDLVWNDRNFMSLFTADYSFVSSELAAIYGVPAPAKEYDQVLFPAGSERAGLLGQGLFLALTSKPADSSPTARGLFVREQFLCQHVPDPPAGVNTNLPPVTEEKPQTNRDRMSEHATNPSCNTCHRLIDPIGFGLEKFDAIGARREKLSLQFGGRRSEGRRAAEKKVDLPIDSTGTVVGIPNSEFSSPSELGAVLARSAQCQECIVKQYFRYTRGHVEMPADRAILRKVMDDFKASQFRFKELIVSLVRLTEFPASERTRLVTNNHQSR